MELNSNNELSKLFNQVLKLHFIVLQKKLDEINMYPGQPKIIHVLSKHESMTQVELAKVLGVTPATINVTLKRMEREELVQRNRSASDNRVTQVVLTEKGKELSSEVNKLMNEIQDITFGNFTEEEFEQLKHILQKLKDNLSQVCHDSHHDCLKD